VIRLFQDVTKVTFVTWTVDLVNIEFIIIYIKSSGHVFTKTNEHVKYKSAVINSYQDNELKQYYTKVTLVALTFDQYMSACKI